MKKLSKIAMLGAASALTLSAPTPAMASADPLLGEIMTVGFNFCPRGWGETAGALLPISSNTALFSLIGTTYGGDGRTTFQLPDLRGRSSVGVGRGAGLSTISWGERGGFETMVLTNANLPSHNHTGNLHAENTANSNTGNPANAALARSTLQIYSSVAPPNPAVTFAAGTVTTNNTGGGQSFPLRDPYLGMYKCIAMQGVFPSRN
ncbi:tail fiber protein [Pontixanthobacter sp. CEM42]|uniref:phage tail protein n=1 Tax=Pontixanthobacter sp. CEM42 TaxID=2792077 RepID=UPI001ADF76E6|nr:tail fiber protein [Pontixanthobacter sp. CEM42]